MSRASSPFALALRRLGASPGFTLAAVASLAIGIGGATAVFSIVQALLLRPMSGISRPDRIVDVVRTENGEGADTFGYLDLLDYRQAKSLENVYGFDMNPFSVRVGETSRRVLGFSVSATYFTALDVRPELGRFFLPEEDLPTGGAPVAVVSHDFFVRELAGDRAAIGSVIRVDSRPFTLVGVAPADFTGLIFGLRPEVFVPLSTALSDDEWQIRKLTSRASAWLLIGGRLAPGASIASAQAELDAIAARIAQAYPESHAHRGARVLPTAPVPGEGRTVVRLFSALLFVLVGLVLAIACMNVASMLLARGEARQRELAVRQALGASSRRIVEQLLVETLLLFALAAAPALLLARWGVDLIAAFRPPTPFPVALDFPVDWRAALFALALALATGLVFGLAPAVAAARRDPHAALRDGTATSGRRPLRWRRFLVGAQVALSLVLLVVAGLLLRALDTARRIDPGFQTSGIVAFEFNLELAGLRGAAGQAELDEIVERARAMPNVTGAAAARMVPLDLNSLGLGGIEVDGVESPDEHGFEADANIVSPGFFSLLGIPLEGRDFAPGDRQESPRVAIVNRTFADRFFPGGAVGRTFHLLDGATRNPYRVVGVARDIKARSLGEERRLFYWVAASQIDLHEMSLLVRASGSTTALAATVGELFRGIDPDLPTGPPRPLDEIAATSTLPQRLAASVAGSLGAIGLFLAAVGLYGVVAYAVVARRKELAVRVALGAGRRNLLRLVFGDAARPVTIGAAVGLAIAFGLSRLLASLLYGLSPGDLVTFAGVPALLFAVAALAVAVPARRALAIEPAAALRSE